MTTRKLLVATTISAVILAWINISGLFNELLSQNFRNTINCVFRDMTPFENSPRQEYNPNAAIFIGVMLALIFWIIVGFIHIYALTKAIDWAKKKPSNNSNDPKPLP